MRPWDGLSSYDPESFGGKSSDGRKVKGTLHWVSAKNAINSKIYHYDRLFSKENPDKDSNFLDALNPESLKIFPNAKLEFGMKNANNTTYQFERLGYFKKDTKLEEQGKNVYIQVVSLRDSWANKLKK